MYEDQTFDVILQRMLSRVPETMDKRESSPIYAALAPAAVELTSMYIAFDCMLAETFGDTASREYLIRLCADRGITPKKATQAVLELETGYGRKKIYWRGKYLYRYSSRTGHL